MSERMQKPFCGNPEALKAGIPKENCWQNWKCLFKSCVPGKNSKYTQPTFNTHAIKSFGASDVMSGDRGHNESHTHIYIHIHSLVALHPCNRTLCSVFLRLKQQAARVWWDGDAVYGSAHPLLLHSLWVWRLRVTYSQTLTNRDTSDTVAQKANHLWL